MWSLIFVPVAAVCMMKLLRDSKMKNFVLGLTFGLTLSLIITSTFNFYRTERNTLFNASTLLRNGDLFRAFRQNQPSSHGEKNFHEEFDRQADKDGGSVNVNLQDDHLHNDDDSKSKELYHKVRVLCWVMTAPKNLDKKAQHVRKTWGKRCNVLLFFSSTTNTSFPTIGLNISEGREHLTGKTVGAFNYVYEHYFDQADWFMKADDDTYVIVENLRYFLSGENSSSPIYFGHHFKTIVKQGYFSGGAGYVFSKEALRRFATTGKDPKICRRDGGAEDAEIGHCMQRLGVKAGNSTDAMGRSRFHCFDPETHLFGGYPGWYYQYDANGAKKGEESISDYAISFHYVGPNKMYSLEFYIYHLRPYGLVSGLQKLNQLHVNRSLTNTGPHRR